MRSKGRLGHFLKKTWIVIGNQDAICLEAGERRAYGAMHQQRPGFLIAATLLQHTLTITWTF